MTFTARYPGRCARTGGPIRPGDRVESIGRGRYALVWRTIDDTDHALDPDVAHVAALDPELAMADPEAAAAAGRYLRQSMARSVSDVWLSGGREYYRNKAGRCEDAPCCGCCNA